MIFEKESLGARHVVIIIRTGLRSKTYAKNAFGYLHERLKLQPESWALAYLGLASQIGQKVPSVKHIQQTY